MKVTSDARIGSVESLLGRAADEFTQEANTGRQPDLEEYARRYPQIASIIREAFPALMAMQRSAPGLLFSNGLEVPSPFGCLGDFRLLREIGRGGMGVVYEATQISLDRAVALKILPLAGMLDQRQLRRFQNEARAAAQLHHPNILPIYSVGCERGVHYYAMQLIDGPTLADVIHHLRLRHEGPGVPRVDSGPAPQPRAGDTGCASSDRPASGSICGPDQSLSGDGPSADGALNEVSACAGSSASIPDAAEVTRESRFQLSAALSQSLGDSITDRRFFRAAAELAIQAAEGLQAAHDEGIVHRDMKPSNLLIDSRGRLWIADFGLARVEHDPGITMTGDVLGTLRYMSPEQALGKPWSVDARSDLYSLGLTVYELLTLTPAIPGRNRQELLRQVAEHDLRLPSQFNPALPVDLETIVTKAIEKDPRDRYSSAQALADDLRRFLEDQPIRARRPTWRDRSKKWCHRHRMVLGAIALTGLAVLAAGAVLLWMERARTFAALGQAQQNLDDSEQHRRAAEAERARADANLGKAREAVDRMLTEAALKLWEVRGTDEARVALLKSALEFYEGFIEQRGDDDSLHSASADVSLRVAEITKGLGQFDRSEEACRSAIAQFERLVAGDPGNIDHRANLARSHHILGGILGDMSRAPQAGRSFLAEAQQHYARSVELRTRLLVDSPGNDRFQQDLAQSHQALGFLLNVLGRRHEAEVHLRSAAEVYDAALKASPDGVGIRGSLAHVLQHLGMMLRDRGRVPEATDCFRRSIKLSSGVQRPARPDAVPHVQRLLGESLAALGRTGEAEDMLREAARGFEIVCASAQFDPEYVTGLSWCHHELALAQQAAGRTAQSEQSFRRAIEIREKLVTEYPENNIYPRHLARGWAHLGALLHDLGRADEAAESFAKARAGYESLVKGAGTPFLNGLWYAELLVHFPDPRLRDPQRAMALARVLLADAPDSVTAMEVLGVAEHRAGRPDRAIEVLEDAIELRQGGGCVSEFHLAMAHWERGHFEPARALFAQGMRWMDEHQPGSVDFRRCRREAAKLLGMEMDPIHAPEIAPVEVPPPR